MSDIKWLLSFIEGPDLPNYLFGHSSVTLDNELIVLGGRHYTCLPTCEWSYSSSVYKISCDDGRFSEWIEMEVKLKTPRAYFVASFIPNDLIDFQSVP